MPDNINETPFCKYSWNFKRLMITHNQYQSQLFGVDYKRLTDNPIDIKVISEQWVINIKEYYNQLAGKKHYAHPKEKLSQYIEYEIKGIVKKLLAIKGKDDISQNAYTLVRQYYKELMILMESG